MKIGGFLKNTMIDFPGLFSCAVFTTGCNFICPYCHNAALVDGSGDEDIDPEEIFGFLKKRVGLIDGVVVSGGEPTLHSDLPEFLGKIKSMGFQIKLDTNGTSPDMLEALIADGALDYVAMDIKTRPRDYFPMISGRDHSRAIAKSIEIILGCGLPHEFRTTCVSPLINRDVISHIAELVSGARQYSLQKYCDKTTLDPSFFEAHPQLLTDRDLEEFKSILEKSVEKCIIR